MNFKVAGIVTLCVLALATTLVFIVGGPIKLPTTISIVPEWADVNTYTKCVAAYGLITETANGYNSCRYGGWVFYENGSLPFQVAAMVSNADAAYNNCIDNKGERKTIGGNEDVVCKLNGYYFYPDTHGLIKNEKVLVDGVVDTFLECFFEVHGAAPGHDGGATSGYGGTGSHLCYYGDYRYYEDGSMPEYSPEIVPDYSSQNTEAQKAREEAMRNQLCPNGMLDLRNNEYDPYGSRYYYLNSCTYDSETGELKYSSWFAHNSCEQTYQNEINATRYNIFNGCLYDNGTRVFEKMLHNYVIDGDFGSFTNIGDQADEWFRFEDGQYLYIYLRGGAGCGGCITSGPYLKINLLTHNIEKKSATNVPYPPNVVLSADKTQGVALDKSLSGEGKADFTLYDFRTNEKVKTIFQADSFDGYVVCGDGCYLAEGVISWYDEDTIQIQKFQMDDNGYTLKSDYAKTNNTWTYYPDGDPVLIDI